MFLNNSLIMLLMSFYSFIFATFSYSTNHTMLNFMNLNSVFNLDFLNQNSSFIFTVVICLVSFMIFFYCYFYMTMSKDLKTFSNVLLSFALSMLVLVAANSLFIYMLGWDGLGVSSFLLVVYYSSLIATRSGLATFITNRMGDFMIIASFILLLSNYNIMTFQNISSSSMYNPLLLSFSMLLMICGAFTKSAQIPFSAWLPAAMAAPTPVSALVHSSTLVTAGMYLLSKFLIMLDLNMEFSKMAAILCVSLSGMAGAMAYVETDFKKMVAMSTLSQMGLIGYILFLKEENFALFHIFSHATFKSLLFLVVGSLMYFNMGYQDTRVKSMPMKMMKTPIILMFLSSMSLMGFMFTSGFFSKDSIILNFSTGGINLIIYILMLTACVLTVGYTIKSFIIIKMNMQSSSTFISKQKSNHLFISSSFLATLTILFGIYYFFCCMDQEGYILESNIKMMGVFIIFIGMLFTRVSWYPMLKYIKDPTTSNNKDLKVFLMQMSNLNWLSNGFSSKNVKTNTTVKMEPLWLIFISELTYKYSVMLYKPLKKSDKDYSKNFNMLITQMIYFIFFCLTVMMLMNF